MNKIKCSLLFAFVNSLFFNSPLFFNLFNVIGLFFLIFLMNKINFPRYFAFYSPKMFVMNNVFYSIFLCCCW